MKLFASITVLLLLFILPVNQPAQVKKDMDNGRIDSKNQWEESILLNRKQTDEYFKTSPTSPMAAKKRLLIRPGQNTVYVVEKELDISTSDRDNPDVLFGVKEKNSQWYWIRRAPGIVCMSGEKLLPTGSPLPSQAEFKIGCCLIKAYTSKDGLALIIYDPLRPELKDFSHLLYFPPNPEFAVQAALKKFDKIEKTTFPTSQKLEKTYYRYASILFKIKDKEFHLSAFKSSLENNEESNTLFIPFSDKTNGSETYDVGRFLEIQEPKESTFILDFNLCFNPLCNYSPAFNCPLPPQENDLDTSINAGEKKYPLSHAQL
jgi:uncharacterized protein